MNARRLIDVVWVAAVIVAFLLAATHGSMLR